VKNGIIAVAGSAVKKIIAFSDTEHPEAIAFNKAGDMFVSMRSGDLRVVRAGSDTPQLFGSVPDIDPASDIGMLGLAIDSKGDVYAGVRSANPQANGVWVFDRRMGERRRIAGTEGFGFANDLTFDERGNLYVTESTTGTIWRINDAKDPEAWFTHPSLEGTGALGPGGLRIGANGIRHLKRTLFVGNSEKTSLVTIPITPSGEPGSPSTVVVFDPIEVSPGVFVPGVPDGIALDVHGNIYVAMLFGHAIVRVSPNGTVETIASGGLLDWPARLAFGMGSRDRQSLFVANYSIGEFLGMDTRHEQGVLMMNVGVPGLVLP
jgi:sugar lactone lactonase YvrE